MVKLPISWWRDKNWNSNNRTETLPLELIIECYYYGNGDTNNTIKQSKNMVPLTKKQEQLLSEIHEYDECIKSILVDLGEWEYITLNRNGAAMVMMPVELIELGNLYSFRGHNWLQLENYKMASADFTQAIKFLGESNNYYGRGKAQYELGCFEKSFKDFTEAIEISPDDVDYYYMRAKSGYMLGISYYQGVVKDLVKVIELDRENAEYYILTTFLSDYHFSSPKKTNKKTNQSRV